MLFAVAGWFREGVEAARIEAHERFNAHIAQRHVRIHFGGPLFDADGGRAGVLLIVEAADFAEAERFLQQSPYQQAGLYHWSGVSEIRPEVGGLR